MKDPLPTSTDLANNHKGKYKEESSEDTYTAPRSLTNSHATVFSKSRKALLEAESCLGDEPVDKSLELRNLGLGVRGQRVPILEDLDTRRRP
jgi:hypothetical protein